LKIAETDMNTILDAGCRMLAQFPSLTAGQLEVWLVCAAALVGLGVGVKLLVARRPGLEAEFVTKSEFREFRTSVEQDLNGLRDRIDSRHLAVLQSIEGLKSSVLAEVARLDERSRRMQPRINTN
jgi:hypothetical protein